MIDSFKVMTGSLFQLYCEATASDYPSLYVSTHALPRTHMVIHPSTNQFQCCLNAVIRYELVKLHHIATRVPSRVVRAYHYLCQGGIVFMTVCLCVSRITKKYYWLDLPKKIKDGCYSNIDPIKF